MRLDRSLILTCLTIASLVPLATPARAEVPQVVFEGSGWGHGVGMSQYGARAMATDGYGAEDIVEYYFTDTTVTPLSGAVSGWLVDDPKPLWVNLMGNPYYSPWYASFAASGGNLTFCQQEPSSVGSMYRAKNEDDYSPYVELLEEKLAAVGYDPGPVDGWFDADTTEAVEAFQGDEGLYVDGIVGANTKAALWPPESGDRCVIETPLTSSALALVPSSDGTECTLQGAFAPGACIGSIRDLSKSARVVIPQRKVEDGTAIQLAHGDIRIRPDRSGGTGSFEGLHVLLEVGVEDYVKGVVEIPFSWPAESLQAQAIAARSYATGIAKGRGPESGFSGWLQDYCWCHLWSNTYSQVYAGYYAEQVLGGVWKQAVSATSSEVIDHPTAGLATAFFSSSSGGATEANEDAWGGSPVPYLRSVDDQWSLDPANPFAHWSYSFDSTTVAAKAGLDELTGVGVVETNQSGSARTVRFVGVSGGVETSVEKSADWVRSVFGLRSNYFDVTWGDVTEPPKTVETPPPTTLDLQDIAGNTFEADIEWLAQQSITKGCNPPDNTLFCPDDRVTRGQMAAFLKRFLDLSPASKDYFVDDDGSTFENDINAVAKAGITKGCNPPDNDRYCPNDRVSREQMAAFIVRALDLEANDHPEFGDVPASNTFYNDIGKLATAGITKGCNPPDNTRYCPKDSVTRGQMAAFLHRSDAFR